MSIIIFAQKITPLCYWYNIINVINTHHSLKGIVQNYVSGHVRIRWLWDWRRTFCLNGLQRVTLDHVHGGSWWELQYTESISRQTGRNRLPLYDISKVVCHAMMLKTDSVIPFTVSTALNKLIKLKYRQNILETLVNTLCQAHSKKCTFVNYNVGSNA